MAPTNAELIFYIIAGIISLVILIGMASVPSANANITWGMRRDWARQEKKWM